MDGWMGGWKAGSADYILSFDYESFTGSSNSHFFFFFFFLSNLFKTCYLCVKKNEKKKKKKLFFEKAFLPPSNYSSLTENVE